MSTIRTLLKDGFDTELQIQGARSQNSNDDISSVVFTNYDNDTSNVYRMAEIVMRDNYGSSNLHGYGNIVIKTGNTGGSNLTERMVIKHGGHVGIGTLNPCHLFDVNGNALIRGTLYTNEPYHFPLNNKKISLNSNIYGLVTTFNAASMRELKGLKIRSFVNSGTYTLRVYNADNNTTLVESVSLSNMKPSITSLALTPTASNGANLELHAKGSSSYAIFDGILLSY